MINKSMRSSTTQQFKESMMMSSMIERLIQNHEKNKQKQIKSENIANKIMKDFEEKKLAYELRNKQKKQEVVRRLKEKLKRRMRGKKKKIENADKMMERYRTLTQEKSNKQIMGINRKNITISKQFQEKSNENSPRSNSSNTKKSKYLNNTLDLKSFYNINLRKTEQKCQYILDRSLQKQRRAQNNRKIINENNKIKQLNLTILNKQIKAAKYLQNKENNIIKKSIIRLELQEKRNEKQAIYEKKKEKARKQKEKKNIQRLKEKRLGLEQQLKEKFDQLEKVIREKQEKVNTNKENLLESLVESKKKDRVKYVHDNQLRLNKSQGFFITKMSAMYQKDREQWNFVTSLEQRKNAIIQQNIYQSSQISLKNHEVK